MEITGSRYYPAPTPLRLEGELSLDRIVVAQIDVDPYRPVFIRKVEAFAT